MPNHGRASAGYCRWCGDAVLIEAGPRKGEISGRRRWHDGCVLTFKLHCWPAVQYGHVAERDGERCRVCEAAPLKLRRGYEGRDYRTGATWCRVEAVVELELDHITPLWSVAKMSAEQRRPFYGPDNLQLLCRAHHLAKCAREAADRASMRRGEKVAA